MPPADGVYRPLVESQDRKLHGQRLRSGRFRRADVLRAPAGGWSDDTDKDYNTYGATSSVYSRYYTDSLWAKPITSIGGTGMLIYPGCRFVLYGVRA